MTATPHPSPRPTEAADRNSDESSPRATELTEVERFILDMLEQLDAAGAKADHLQRALEHSRDIGAAVGVLMAQHRLRQQDAFDLLRRTSQDQNRKLYDLALDVVSTGELPHADRAPGA